MPSLRQLRGRLRSIQSTKQVMRAMQLVSGSKLKRAQAKLFQARAVLGFLDGLLARVLAAAPALEHPLAASREGAPELLVLFTSDAGLCGAYNANLIQRAEAELARDTARPVRVVFIGKKGHRYFTRRGVQGAEAHLDLAGRPDLSRAERIARALMERFLSGQAGAVRLLYPRVLSPVSYKPTVLTWLPISLSTQRTAGSAERPAHSRQHTGDSTEHTAHSTQRRFAREAEHPAPRPMPPAPDRRGFDDYIFEPSPEAVFRDLLPRWALATFQLVMLEAFTAEHSARMIAMKNATDNAEELLKSLTLQRNKIRQASITKEISEIVGTAEALK